MKARKRGDKYHEKKIIIERKKSAFIWIKRILEKESW